MDEQARAPGFDRFALYNATVDDPNVSRTAGTVLWVLFRYFNERGEAWPSISTIARKAGAKRETIRTGIAELVELGYLTQRPRGQSYSYKLGWPKGARVAERGPGKPDQSGGGDGRNSANDVGPERPQTDQRTNQGTHQRQIEETEEPEEHSHGFEGADEDGKSVDPHPDGKAETEDEHFRAVLSGFAKIWPDRTTQADQAHIKLVANLAYEYGYSSADVVRFAFSKRTYFKNGRTESNSLETVLGFIQTDAPKGELGQSPSAQRTVASRGVGRRENYAERPAVEYEVDERSDEELLADAGPELVQQIELEHRATYPNDNALQFAMSEAGCSDEQTFFRRLVAEYLRHQDER